MIRSRSFDGMALFSECMRHRYHLTRRVLNPTAGAFAELGWIMFNPSTADATTDDATIRKVRGFTERAGYAEAHVVNLFSLRARDPREVVLNLADASTDDNLRTIEAVARECRAMVCAWGTLADTSWGREQVRMVLGVIPPETRLLCIDTAKSGTPVHPLMQAYAKGLRPWIAAGERAAS